MSTNTPSTTRPILLSGQVLFDDGTHVTGEINHQIRIERVCGGLARLEAYPDSKGRFSFQIGQGGIVDTEIADEPQSLNGLNGRSMGQPSSPSGRTTFNGMGNTDRLWDCELRAAYPGYRSEVIELGSRRSLDNPDVGTVVLHRLASVQGTTVSLTTALAPKQARKSFEKGEQLLVKGRLAEAEKQFRSATTSYPEYAVAWFQLGEVQNRQGRLEDAKRPLRAAISADSKYVSPYDRLAYYAAQEGDWDKAAELSRQMIQLNSVEFPNAYWLNALANYHLNNDAEAEKSLEELLKLDKQHVYPDADRMMAQLMMKQGNDSQAARYLREYLALVPDAQNADMNQLLHKLETASGGPNR